MKEGKALRAWRPALGVLAVGVFAFSFTLRGAPPDSERTQGTKPGALTAANASVKTVQSSAQVRVLPPQKADYRRSPVVTVQFEGATAIGPGPTVDGVASVVCSTAEECSDCNPCTEDVCTLGVCTHPNEPDGPGVLGCDDGVFCNGEELCQSGVCNPAATVACTAEFLEGCDEAAQNCVPPQCNDDANCQDDVRVCHELADNAGAPCTNDGQCTETTPNSGVCVDCTDNTCNQDTLQCEVHNLCVPGRCCGVAGCTNLTERQCLAAGFDFLAIDEACAVVDPSGNLNDCPDYAAGIAPQGDWPAGGLDESPTISSLCGQVTEYVDHYETEDHAGLDTELQYMEIEFLRFTGRVLSTYSARWDIAFYDEAGVLVEDVFWPDGQDQTTTDWVTNTVDFDPPLVIPTKGQIGFSVQANFSPGGLVQVRLTDAVDVGLNWGVDGEIVAMELIGTLTSEPLGACCDIAIQGECFSKRPWICNDDGGIYQGTGTACNICSDGPAQFFNCTTGGDECNNVCDDASTNAGQPCVSNFDCHEGDCDTSGSWSCIPLATCANQACCDVATGNCAETDQETCPVGVGQGFGTTCDPNCCVQPLASYSGADDCNDPNLLQFITVPVLGQPPITVTITGDNSTATNDDQAICTIWGPESAELGWWEGFTTTPAFDGPDCFNVRIDFCCTDIIGEPLRPAWGNLVTGCEPCGALLGNAGVEPPLGLGRSTTGFARGGPFCAEDNLWGTFGPLRTGAYYYPIYTTPAGTSGVPPGATYQLHFTIGACPVAACCSGETCEVLTELDCAELPVPGYFMGPPNLEAAVVDCGVGGAICSTGSCCTGPGECVDSVLQTPVSLADCVGITGDPSKYVGGAKCDNPGIPCPLCEIQQPATCQLIRPGNNQVTMSDISAPGGSTVLADNFVPTTNTATTVCVWGALLDGRRSGGWGCDADLVAKGIEYNFTVKIFGDAGGLPDTSNLLGARRIVEYFKAEKLDQTGDYNALYGATGGGSADENAFAFQLVLDPPITGLVPGTCYWLEVSAETWLGADAPPNSCEFNLLTKSGATPAGFSMAGTWINHTDFNDTGESVYEIGGGRPFDYAFCIDCGLDPNGCGEIESACCTCGTSATCSLTSLDTCMNTTGGTWDQAPGTCQGHTCATALPAGDLCSDAIVITDGSYLYDASCATTTEEVALITTDAGEMGFGAEIWYDYTATCTGKMRMSMCGTGSNYDSAVAIFVNSLDPNAIACPGDAGFGQDGEGSDEGCNGIYDAGAGWLTRTVEKGDRFLFAVGGFEAAAGPGQFAVACQGVGCIVPQQLLAESSVTNLGFGARNRYLSFEIPSVDVGWPMALRVTFIDLPTPYDIWNGTVMWVQAPTDVSEASGDSGPGAVNFSKAGLGCDPDYQDFSFYPGGVHIAHEGIVPGGTYQIEAIRDACDVVAENFSDPLIIMTSSYGDVNKCDALGDCSKPPNGATDFDDIGALVDKFKNLPSAIKKSRTDLVPEILDSQVDFGDIPAAVDGFRGLPYAGVPSDVNKPCTTP